MHVTETSHSNTVGGNLLYPLPTDLDSDVEHFALRVPQAPASETSFDVDKDIEAANSKQTKVHVAAG